MNPIRQLIVLSVHWALAASAGLAMEERPNILLILSDDHNYRALGSVAGNEILRTPNLDRLASEGVYFNRCFTPNPICTPSRACLYTGQDSWTNGVTFNGKAINPDSPLFPRLLAQSGYETYFVGKWHNDGQPWNRGFTIGGRCYVGGRFDQFHMSVVKFGDDPRNRQTVDRYSTSVFTDDALEYLQEERSQPFCMVVSYTVGHDAWLAPPGFAGKYAPSQVPLPPNFMTKPPFQQFNSKIRDETLLRFPRTRADVRTATAGYYAMIEHMDEHIGQLLDALQRRSLAAETLVIFLSVKGLSLGSHGILGKQTLYEEGIRTSLIVRHPKLRAASRTNSELVSTIDLLPTICEAAGVRIPASVEGQSLLGVYDGTRKGRQRLFFSYHDPNRSTVTRAVRTQRYKLIHHLLTDERQLFDLSNDPYEFKNLANLPEHQSVERDLTHALLVWRAGSEEK